MSGLKVLKHKELLIQKNFIDNQWIEADSGHTLDVKNPFNDAVIGKIPKCGKAEATRAVEAAHRAWAPWRSLTFRQRADLLMKWWQLIHEQIDELAILMTMEHGKPVAESKAELQFGLNFIRWFAEEGRRAYGEIIPANQPHHRLLILKESIGVVGLITPWNFPMATLMRTGAAAIAAGCPVVAKPSEETPYSALAVAHLGQKAGLPAGVFNIVTGDAPEIGKVLTTHPYVRAFAFTGSTAVGKLLQKQCTDTVKKVSMELGGNSPLIVFEDADLDLAVKGAVASKFRNMGQTCVCANRLYVHESLLDPFVQKFVKECQAFRLGNGLEEGVTMGPLINRKATQKIERLIEDAVSKGAKILCGGKVPSIGQNFFEPTVVVNANDKMEIRHEEIFGPVAVFYKFRTEQEAIREANHTQFGLASFFFTQDLNRFFRVAEAIESGVVSVNEGVFSTEVVPFGGFKESGNGREGGRDGLQEFLETKYVCLGNVR